MKMRKAFAGVVIGAMVLGLAACGSSSTSTSTTTTTTADETDGADEAAADDGEVKTIYIYQMKTEIQDALEEVCAKYSETHPGVEFICESASDNYSTSLKSMFEGGDAPDIFSVQGYNDAVLWQSHLADLSDQPWVENMVEASAANVTVDDKVIAWPFSVEFAGYVYNTSLFEQAGIEEVPTTSEALGEAVDKLTELGVSIPITECYLDWYQLGNFMINLGFAGQDDPAAFIQGLNDGTESFVGNEVWEELADYIAYEYSIASAQDSMAFNLQTSQVGSQDIAITIGGNWSQPTYDDIDPELPVALMGIPYSSNEEENDQLYLVGTYWGINADSDVAEECKEFFTWLTTDEEGIECLTKDLQVIPPYTNIEADTESIGALGQSAVEYMNAGKVDNVWNTFYPDGFAQQAGELCQAYNQGELDKDGFLQSLQDAWDSLSE